jgi:hypothetical protein
MGEVMDRLAGHLVTVFERTLAPAASPR